MGEALASLGRVVLLRTRGRTSGQPVTAAVGYVEEPDGSLLVAASDPETHWARNLVAHAVASVARGGSWRRYQAEVLEADDHAAAVRALILRYGTPAERLGRGPSFRLRPIADGTDSETVEHPEATA